MNHQTIIYVQSHNLTLYWIFYFKYTIICISQPNYSIFYPTILKTFHKFHLSLNPNLFNKINSYLISTSIHKLL